MPSKTLDFDTPLTILKSQFSHIPSLGSLSLKVFGYSAYALVPSKYRSILDPTTIKCLFLGYSPTRKGYKCSIRQGEKDTKKDVELLIYSKRPLECRLVQEFVLHMHDPYSF